MRRFLHFLSALPTAALAETAGSAIPDTGGSLVQVVLGLAVVLALLVGGLILLKRLSAPRGAASGVLKVLAGAAVGPRERIVVVEVGESWLVVGVAPGSVASLHTMPKQALPAAPEGSAHAVKDFGAWLKQAMEKKNAR